MVDSSISHATGTPVNIPLERSMYVGIILSGIIYGESPPKLRNQPFALHLTKLEAGLEMFAFFAAAYSISHRPPEYRKRQKFYIIYGGILLLFTTIEVTLEAMWGQYMWIDHRNYPGGPLGYFGASQTGWCTVFGSAAGIAVHILGDGLLVRSVYS
jgi:hypothetical protein